MVGGIKFINLHLRILWIHEGFQFIECFKYFVKTEIVLMEYYAKYA